MTRKILCVNDMETDGVLCLNAEVARYCICDLRLVAF